MGYFWCISVVISFVFAVVNGCVEETVSAMLSGATEAVESVLSFGGIMCLWSGIMELAVKSGFVEKIKRLILPFIKFIFPNLDKKSKVVNYITLNITANLIGTGNAATPMGLVAMEELKNISGGKISEEMCCFAVINTSAFQLIPSSIIALRSACKSVDSFSVVTPIWICSLLGLASALIAVKIMYFFINRLGRKGK